jgi:hypothetical protein
MPREYSGTTVNTIRGELPFIVILIRIREYRPVMGGHRVTQLNSAT